MWSEERVKEEINHMTVFLAGGGEPDWVNSFVIGLLYHISLLSTSEVLT